MIRAAPVVDSGDLVRGRLIAATEGRSGGAFWARAARLASRTCAAGSGGLAQTPAIRRCLGAIGVWNASQIAFRR